jgi:hypothetical protein
MEKEEFIKKAKLEKANFELHKKLIEYHLCDREDKDYSNDIKEFAEKQVIDGNLLLSLMEYAEEYSQKKEYKKMENKFLQSVERYTDKEQGKTGYKAIYSNGLDFETLLFPVKNGVDNINIPSIVKSVMTIEEIESIGAELLTSKSK